MVNLLIYICLWLGFVSAIVAGVFLSFSDFVMAGLARTKPAGGIESMQHINRTVFRSVFLISFFLLVPLTISFAIYVALQAEGWGRTCVAAAATTYLVAVFAVTVVGNVPLNKRLDRMDHTSIDTAEYWQKYSRDWTRLNHVRTFGSLATSALFLLAVVAFGQ